ncbi:MAG TPA: hypothetical protein VJH34_03185 [archaeon]|nr:hypothetical protein [archaeon]
MSTMEPEKLYASILSAINTELKAATLLCLGDDPRTSSAMGKYFKEFGGSRSAGDWIPVNYTFEQLLNHSHVPLGFAEKVVGKRAPAWKLTEIGKKYAVPAARYAIKVAVDRNQSMVEILGRSGSPGDTNAPYNRARILETLEDCKGVPLSIKDFVDDSGTELGGVSTHMAVLSKSGLIEYKSVSNEVAGWSNRIWSNPQFSPENMQLNIVYGETSRKTVVRIAQVIYNNGPVDYSRITDILNQNGVKMGQASIQNAIRTLEANGLIKSEYFKEGVIVSDARITEKGSKFVDHLAKLRLFLDDCNPNAIDVEFQDHYVVNAVNLYRPHSHANILSPEERFASFNAAFERHGKPMRPVAYAKLEGIDRMKAQTTLTDLYKKGFVDRKHVGKASLYFPKQVKDEVKVDGDKQ